MFIHRRAVLLLVLLTTLSSAGAEPPQAVPEPRLTIVTASSHCDWTWGHTRAWHAERYAQIIRNVLLLMRRHPHYVWQLETENEELAPFLEQARQKWPELIDEFWQRVREGRIEVIGAISAPRLCEVYPETMVRNLVLGKQYFRAGAPGVPQPVYHAVDVMVGHSQMPQLLTQAEYRCFVFSRPSQQKQVFWRTGLDGTRMLSVLQHYGFGGVQAGGIALESHSGDDILPSEDVVKAAATWDSNRKVLATSARFFEEVERTGCKLPELKGPLDSLESFCCGTGLHGNRNLYTWNNQNEDLLLAVERAQVMASALGGRSSPSTTDALWHDLLSCVGHAILWSWQADYDERMEKAKQTRSAGEKALQEALADVASRIQFRTELGSPLVVFNFHAWPVTGPVEMALEGEFEQLSLRDDGGRHVGWQLVEDGPRVDRRLAFIAEHVPACGYKTFYLQQADGNQSSRHAPPAVVTDGVADGTRSVPATIENRWYRVRMGGDGGLHVTERAREGKLGAETTGLGDVVFYDAPVPKGWMMNGPLGQRHQWTAIADGFRSCRGPVFDNLQADGRIGPHRVRREVRLWRDCRRIEFSVEIEAEPGCGVFFLRFPLNVEGRVFAGIPFGAEPREGIAHEPFRGEYFALGYPDAYYATRWTDVSSEDFGYTFIAPHGMHHGYEYKPQQRSLEFALLRLRPMPEGSWNQVHPSIQGTGPHRWTCALVPHAGTWREAATYRDALQLHSPLAVYSPTGGMGRANLAAPTAAAASGSAADSESFAELTPASAVLSSLRCLESDTGDAVVWEMRLYETTGQPAETTVRLRDAVREVQVTNLLGRPDPQAVPPRIAGREVRLQIPPWKIVTLRAVVGKR